MAELIILTVSEGACARLAWLISQELGTEGVYGFVGGVQRAQTTEWAQLRDCWDPIRPSSPEPPPKCLLVREYFT